MLNSKMAPNYGNKAGFFIFRWTILHFGLIPAYAILSIVIAYYVLFRPSAYRAASYYLQHRFPGKSFLKRVWLTYKHYYNFGQCLIDQAAVGILGPGAFTIDFPDAGLLRELASENHGIVFLTSHIGIWQQAIATLGYLERRVYLNLRPDMNAHAMGLAELQKAGVEVHVISPDLFLGGVPELTTALLHGHIASIMGDRVFREGAGSRVKFLGEEVLFPLLPFHLAITTQSDLVVFLPTRKGRGHFAYEVEIKRISGILDNRSRDEARILLLNWYVDILERYVEKYPFMWFNFMNSWENPGKR